MKIYPYQQAVLDALTSDPEAVVLVDKRRRPLQMIFVFGSNLAGRHGRGAAQTAFAQHGAVYGQGRGLQGNSYAVPTKDANLKPLPLSVICANVREFLDFAKWRTDLTFNVTALGTGLAGYPVNVIAPFFKGYPANCRLPDSFLRVLSASVATEGPTK